MAERSLSLTSTPFTKFQARQRRTTPLSFDFMFLLSVAMTEAKTETSPKPENLLTIELKSGSVVIELFPQDAPNHVKRIKELAKEGKYDGVAFHRVIDGFMAQTGDVEVGNSICHLARFLVVLLR